MATPSPIAGNENFTLVENAANQFQNMQVAFEEADEMKVQRMTVYDENLAKEVVGIGTIYTVTGYAPNAVNVNEFGTLTSGNGLFLNRQPKQPAATAVTDPQLLHLPAGAVIVGMRLTNNGVPMTGVANSTLNVGTEAWAAAAVGSTNLANATPTGASASPLNSGVNSKGGVKFFAGEPKITVDTSALQVSVSGGAETVNVTGTANADITNMTLGTKGIDMNSGVNGVLVTAPATEVSVFLNAQNLVTGDLAVKLWYLADTEVPGDRP
jgi:hypothetical protein